MGTGRPKVLAALQVVAVWLVASGCGSGGGFGSGYPDAGGGRFRVSASLLDFGPVDPNAGIRYLSLRVENIGSAAAWLQMASVETSDPTSGTFALGRSQPSALLAAGAGVDLEVAFTPRPRGATGCGQHAIGSLELEFDGEPRQASVLLAVHGACELPLRCHPEELVFSGGQVDRVEEGQVVCYNFDTESLLADEVRLSVGGVGGFSMGETTPPVPVTLVRGGSLALSVRYQPPREGASSGALTIRTRVPDSSAPPQETVIRLRGGGGGTPSERPPCSAGFPPDPQPVLDGPGYTIVLESNQPSTYAGVIRAEFFYGDHPPLIGDVLLVNGGYADPSCTVGQKQDEHYAYYENCNVEPGDQFINIHALPANPEIESWVRDLDLWDSVSVRGYEVERINYADGHYWTDRGCHTLILTWICDN